MSNLVKKINAFWKEEDGVTAIEYGLIAALIAVVLIAGATVVGTSCLLYTSDAADDLA